MLSNYVQMSDRFNQICNEVSAASYLASFACGIVIYAMLGWTGLVVAFVSYIGFSFLSRWLTRKKTNVG